jgi:hypothetical protein
MNRNPNQDRDNRNGHGHDNDNGRGDKATVPAQTGGALTSLAALTVALNGVDMTSVGGRSGMPMLQFKSRESGTWTYGQRQTVVEDGSCWAVNPLTFKRGFICFNDNNKVIGERLVSVRQPMPELTELPDKGSDWQEQWAVSMKCTSGTDAGTEVVYKPTTVGGVQAVAGLIEAVRDRLNRGDHDDKISPVVHLDKDSYQHAQHGRIWTPLVTIVDWMPLNGPAPAPAPASLSSAEQPRRRRVA